MKKKVNVLILPADDGVLFLDKESMTYDMFPTKNKKAVNVAFVDKFGIHIATTSIDDKPSIPISFLSKLVDQPNIKSVMIDVNEQGNPVTRKNNTVIVSKIRELFTRDEIYSFAKMINPRCTLEQVNVFFDNLP